MRRPVTLQDAQGDEITGYYHPATQSDYPGTVTVNGTRWFEPEWARQGWRIIRWGEWET